MLHLANIWGDILPQLHVGIDSNEAEKLHETCWAYSENIIYYCKELEVTIIKMRMITPARLVITYYGVIKT